MACDENNCPEYPDYCYICRADSFKRREKERERFEYISQVVAVVLVLLAVVGVIVYHVI